jgi:hypothetical protein
MAVRTEHFPEYDLSLCVISGAHTCEEAVAFFQGLDSRHATRWIHYFHPSVDMSGHDVACLPKLKRAIAAKREELFGAEPKLYIVVCPSKASCAFFEFWRSFVEAGQPHGAAPLQFDTLEAACEALGLPEPERRAVIEAARDRAAEPQPAVAKRPPPASLAPAPESREPDRP